jgi:hypothetical protein
MGKTETSRLAPTKGCEFIAAKDISFAGKDFAKGESFTYADLGLTEQHAQNIWDAELIDVDPASIVSKKPLIETPVVATPAEVDVTKKTK